MSTSIVCFKCGKISKTKEALKLHNYKVHGVGVVSCDQCGKTFEGNETTKLLKNTEKLKKVTDENLHIFIECMEHGGSTYS